MVQKYKCISKTKSHLFQSISSWSFARNSAAFVELRLQADFCIFQFFILFIINYFLLKIVIALAKIWLENSSQKREFELFANFFFERLFCKK